MKIQIEKKIEIVNFICALISTNKSVRQIFRDNKIEIKRQTFFEWIKINKDFSDQYVRACEDREDAILDEIMEIADDNTKDFKTLENGATVLDVEHIQRSRLRIDVRKWDLSKKNPKKYGDRHIIEGDKENPLIPAIDLSKISSEILEQIANAYNIEEKD